MMIHRYITIVNISIQPKCVSILYHCLMYHNMTIYYPVKPCIKEFCTVIYLISLTTGLISRYRIAQNVGGGKHWQIWRLTIDSPKFSHPSIVSTLKCNGKPTQFAKVLPSNYTSRVISPKFHPANILRYTVSVLGL